MPDLETSYHYTKEIDRLPISRVGDKDCIDHEDEILVKSDENKQRNIQVSVWFSLSYAMYDCTKNHSLSTYL